MLSLFHQRLAELHRFMQQLKPTHEQRLLLCCGSSFVNMDFRRTLVDLNEVKTDCGLQSYVQKICVVFGSFLRKKLAVFVQAISVQTCLCLCEARKLFLLRPCELGFDAAQGMDCHASSEKVVRSVAWATTTVCPLASGFSSSTVSDTTVSVAAKEVFATTHTESSSSKSAGAKFSRNCCRSSTRQSHSARKPRSVPSAVFTRLP